MDIYSVAETSDPAFRAIVHSYDPDIHDLEDFVDQLYQRQCVYCPVKEILYEDALKRAEAQAASTWSAYDHLRDKFKSMAGKAREFWQNQTIKRRRAYLKRAWGRKLPEVHQPDLVVFLDQVSGVVGVAAHMLSNTKEKFEEESDRFRLPQINYADLADGDDSLPSMMESRARNDPCAFWKDDLRRQALGQNILTHLFLPYAEMDFRSRSGYGVPRPFKPKEGIPDKGVPEIQRIVHFETKASGAGFLILDAQERLYGFLQKMSEILLEDMGAVQTAVGGSTQVIAPQAASTGSEHLRMILREPYILPTSDGVQQLCQLARAHLNASEDHLWKLRENPHYYRVTIREQVEHHWGWVLDSSNKRHPLIDAFSLGHSSKKNNILWEWAIRRTLVPSVLFCEMWNEIFQSLNRIELVIQHPPNISPETALSDEYISAIFLLRRCLQAQISLCLGGEMFLSHPSMRSHLVRVTEPNTALGEQGKSTFDTKQNVKKDDYRDRLIRVFQFLSLPGGIRLTGLRNLTSYAMFLSEGRATTGEASEVTTLFSRLVMRFLGDLSSMAEILYQLERSQPTLAHYNQFKLGQDLEVRFFQPNSFGNTVLRLNEIVTNSGMLTPTMLSFGAPVGSYFEYPIDKPPNKKRREQILKGEERLATFWEHILTTKLFTEASEYLKQVIKSQVIFQTPRDAPSTTEAVASTSTAVASSSQTAPLDPVAPFGGTFQFQEPAAQSRPVAPKEKEKTRGVPGKSSADLPPAEIDVEMTEAPLVFEVDADGWEMVNMLFHIPGARPSSEARWTEFLRLLRVMGFEARQLGGSAWVFNPMPGSALHGKGPVIVHEPHGSGAGGRKLAFQYARVNGDILRHRYGISGENFALSD